MRKPILALLACTLFVGCKTTPPAPSGPVPEFEVMEVEVEVTQPSIAPEYRTDTTYTLGPGDVENWDDFIDEVLDETKVNDAVTLRRHIEMRLAKDEKGLAFVHEKAPPPEPQPTGGSQSDLTLKIVGGENYSLEYGFEYSGAISELWEATYDKGSVSKSSPERYGDDELEPVPSPVDFAMTTTHARYFKTNRSIPPQHQSKDVWILRSDDVPNWDELIDRVLDTTMVNGEMTVREHAKMLAEDEAEGLKRLEPPPGMGRAQPTGAPTIDFALWDGETVVYSFRSKLDYTGDAFSEFEAMVKEKGTFTSTPRGGHPKPVKVSPSEDK